MEPTQELIDDIYRDRVERARSSTLDQKFLAGYDVFCCAMTFVESGIRMQNPDADEQRVRVLLRERLELGRRLEAMPPIRFRHHEVSRGA